ncbi:hypothetical protein AgCh_018128 [Apium graveolens]
MSYKSNYIQKYNDQSEYVFDMPIGGATIKTILGTKVLTFNPDGKKIGFLELDDLSLGNSKLHNLKASIYHNDESTDELREHKQRMQWFSSLALKRAFWNTCMSTYPAAHARAVKELQRRYDLTGIPYEHVIDAILDRRYHHVDYVSDFYKKQKFLASYKFPLEALKGEELWEVHSTDELLPPDLPKKLRGRPKKMRRKED